MSSYRFRPQWALFWASRGRVLLLAASVLVTVGFGLLVAGGVRSTCVTGQGEGRCPPPLLGPDGTAVNDRYYFVHQPLRGDGGITARVADLTGQIRLPDAVPGVRNVTSGVVPWAKAGLIVRQSIERGSSYAAVMVTGGHGVRMQHDFTHDVPGGPSSDPQWLRLTRSGNTLTGYASRDGRTWTQVGTVELDGLTGTVEIGLFAASPGALHDDMAARFSQVSAVFDQITLNGAGGPWRHDDVGVVMEADGTTPHHPGAATESGHTITVTGSGDIGPATLEGGIRADFTLLAAALGLILVIAATASFAATGPERLPPATIQAAVAGTAAFIVGLASSGIVVPAGLALLRAHDNRLQPLTPATELRVIIGYAALSAATAVLTVGLAALLRRRVLAAGLAVTLVVVPDLLALAGVAPWLQDYTPSAGFAITQSVPTFAHVDAEPSIIGLHHPLPPWAGLAVTCGYAALTLAATAAYRTRRRR